jgi:hypothetical protein
VKWLSGRCGVLAGKKNLLVSKPTKVRNWVVIQSWEGSRCLLAKWILSGARSELGLLSSTSSPSVGLGHGVFRKSKKAKRTRRAGRRGHACRERSCGHKGEVDDVVTRRREAGLQSNASIPERFALRAEFKRGKAQSAHRAMV